MAWNLYWNQNDVTHFSPFESTGDSEEVKSDVYGPPHYDNNYGQAQDEVVKDVYEDAWFPFKEGEYSYNDNDNDDDAQSCSYDHSSYINTSYCNTSYHGQSQMLVYDVDDDDNNDGDVVDDDEINKNLLGESKMVDPSNGHNFCVDSSNDQREIDRRFWENCFAT